MRLINKSIYALALASMMGLWSCSQDIDIPVEIVTTQQGKVDVTIQVSRNAAQTRTVLSENEGGTLSDVWSSGDQLHVYDKEGKDLGTLTITDGIGTADGTFRGSLDTTDEGVNEYRLWYYNNNDHISIDQKDGKLTLKVNTSSQNYSNIQSMSAMDIMSQGIVLSIKDGAATVVEHGILESHLAIARFSLKDLPEKAKGYLNIYDINGYSVSSETGEESYNTITTVQFNLIDGTVAATSSQKNGITISDLAAGQDVYVAFVPGTYKLGFKYKDLNDDSFYTCKLTTDNTLEAGYYYCDLISGENAQVSGISIPVIEKNDPNNPLTKWTKTNIEKVSSTQYNKAKFANSYKDNGDYYQFGRNVGFKDYKEAAKTTYVYKGNAPRNFYDGTATATMVPTFTLSDLKTNNIKKAFLACWTYNKSDWWPTETKPTHTWKKRAELCGYNSDDLFVINGVKYRLPDVKDVREIVPDGKGITEELNEIKEIRTVNGHSIAYRYKKVKIEDANYYQVKAKVLNTNNSSILSTISWDDDEDVATRYFKAASYILPFLDAEDMYYQSDIWGNKYTLYYRLKEELGYSDDYININYTYGSTGYYAFAAPWGKLTPELVKIAGGIDVRFNLEKNYSAEYILGNYWMTIDQLGTDNAYFSFCFNPNNYGGLGSYVNAYTGADHCAFPIRLIKSE